MVQQKNSGSILARLTASCQRSTSSILHPSLTQWQILATELSRTLVSSFDNSIYSPLHMFKDQSHCIVTLYSNFTAVIVVNTVNLMHIYFLIYK